MSESLFVKLTVAANEMTARMLVDRLEADDIRAMYRDGGYGQGSSGQAIFGEATVPREILVHQDDLTRATALLETFEEDQ